MYSFTYQELGVMYDTLAYPWAVDVVNHQIMKITDANLNVVPGMPANNPTFENLFAIIEEALALDAAMVDVTYSAAYGFPTRMSIDYHEHIVDEEVSIEVSNFIPVLPYL